MSKLKGSIAAIKMKYLLFVFATVMLVALPTRVYQLLAVVDPANGFYKESDITVSVLYVIVFVFVLLFMGMSFLSKEIPSPKLPEGKNPVLGITSVLMVFGLIWDIIAIEKSVVPKTGEEFIMERFVSTLVANVKDSGGILLVMQFLFAIFAIFYFLVFAISHLNGKGSYKEFKLLALSPLCWCMTMLISKLMKAISFITVSELLFEIFMLVFAMLFFLTFARISSGVFTVDSMWGIFGYGLSACLFAGLVTVPRIAVLVAGKESVAGHEFSGAHMAMLVFIFSYIIASLGVGFKDGIANRRTITEVELPNDDEVVIKKEIKVEEPIDLFSGNEIDFAYELADEEEKTEDSFVEEPIEEAEEAAFDEEPIEEAEEVVFDEEPIEEAEEAVFDEEPVEEDFTEESVREDVPEYKDSSEKGSAFSTVRISDYEEESISAADKIKKAFGFGKKDVEPEVIKPLSLADLRKSKDE